MNLIKFWRAIIIMPLDELKRYIKESEKNFVYSKDSLKKILKGAECWKYDWVNTFKRLLIRIKKGQGALDHNNEKGRIVNDPLSGNRFMAVFFEPRPEGSYFIYDFKLDFRNNL